MTSGSPVNNRPHKIFSWLISKNGKESGAAGWDAPGYENLGTETMYSIAHVKRGMEVRYGALSAQAWALYRKLDLVLPQPHVVVRGDTRSCSGRGSGDLATARAGVREAEWAAGYRLYRRDGGGARLGPA